MKRTPLKRKTSLRPNSYAEAVARMRAPLRRKTTGGAFKPVGAPLRRTPLKKVSKSQRNRLAKYHEIANEFLRTKPACGICLVLGESARPATEVHHQRGRAGRLLFDTRFFVPSCRTHREWPHENPREARALGVLAEARDWNVSLREST